MHGPCGLPCALGGPKAILRRHTAVGQFTKRRGTELVRWSTRSQAVFLFLARCSVLSAPGVRRGSTRYHAPRTIAGRGWLASVATSVLLSASCDPLTCGVRCAPGAPAARARFCLCKSVLSVRGLVAPSARSSVNFRVENTTLQKSLGGVSSHRPRTADPPWHAPWQPLCCSQTAPLLNRRASPLALSLSPLTWRPRRCPSHTAAWPPSRRPASRGLPYFGPTASLPPPPRFPDPPRFFGLRRAGRGRAGRCARYGRGPAQCGAQAYHRVKIKANPIGLSGQPPGAAERGGFPSRQRGVKPWPSSRVRRGSVRAFGQTLVPGRCRLRWRRC